MTIQLTQQAVSRVQEMLSKEQLQKGFLRLKVIDGGCSGKKYQMSIEQAAHKDDHTFEQSQTVSVCVDPESYPIVEGTVIDYIKDTFQEGFKIKNKKEKGSCGCGSSFNI